MLTIYILGIDEAILSIPKIVSYFLCRSTLIINYLIILLNFGSVSISGNTPNDVGLPSSYLER